MGRILDTLGFWMGLFFKFLPYLFVIYLVYLLSIGFNKALWERKKGFDLFLFACKDVVLSIFSHLKIVFKGLFFVLIKISEKQQVQNEKIKKQLKK